MLGQVVGVCREVVEGRLWAVQALEGSVVGGVGAGRTVILRNRSSSPRRELDAIDISSLMYERSGERLISIKVFSSFFVKELFLFARSANLERASSSLLFVTVSWSILERIVSRSDSRIL